VASQLMASIVVLSSIELVVTKANLRSLYDFLNLPNPSVCTGPGVYSASNRSEYQKHKNNNVSGE
jgi:hypothetical protein